MTSFSKDTNQSFLFIHRYKAVIATFPLLVSNVLAKYHSFQPILYRYQLGFYIRLLVQRCSCFPTSERKGETNSATRLLILKMSQHKIYVRIFRQKWSHDTVLWGPIKQVPICILKSGNGVRKAWYPWNRRDAKPTYSINRWHDLNTSIKWKKCAYTSCFLYVPKIPFFQNSRESSSIHHHCLCLPAFWIRLNFPFRRLLLLCWVA